METREISWRSPYGAFAPLDGVPWAHLLHGGDKSADARWSIIVAFPTRKVVVREGVLYLDGALEEGSAFDELQELVINNRVTTKGVSLPFQSGLVGFVGYEMAPYFEPSLSLPASPFDLPDVAFGRYEAAALFDRVDKKSFVTGADARACDRLQEALGGGDAADDFSDADWAFTSNATRDIHMDAVAVTIEEIRNGRLFQANLAHQITGVSKEPSSGLGLFRRIAEKSDAEHGALLQFEEGAIISNSPERFFRITPHKQGRRISAEPIKGTRPRDEDSETDASLAQELLEDPKDRAENIMIADLMRNDLSRICEDGSINVDTLCEIMSLTRVHHLVSRISGQLKPDIGLQEIFAALFPSGSITGAPKVEAMKVIAEREKIGRGPYCGAIGYIDDSGAADFSVAIRTSVLANKGVQTQLTFPVGGGITLRSDPAAEYQETLVKARGVLAGLGADWDGRS